MSDPSYILIGQGIAGTVLSMKMQERGISHIVIDKPHLSSSSKVAAGIVNPIVLKRLKLVKNAEQFMSASTPFYRDWENKLGNSFYHLSPVYHLLQSVQEVNSWMEKSVHPAYAPFMENIKTESISGTEAPFGWGALKQTAWLDTSAFLSSFRSFLEAHQMYRELTVDQNNLADIIAEFPDGKVIWCNGHLLSQSIPETAAFFSPTRGELITIRSTTLPQDRILHAGVFILPVGNHTFKVGATYHWDKLQDNPTPEGKEYLLKELEKLYSGSYEILDHQAGVRPNTKDRKPLLGKYGKEYIFNGMGSRGVLMAPHLADIFIDYLLSATLPREYDIHRFT